MSLALLLILSVVALLLLALLPASRALRGFFAAGMIAVGVFCVFGFLASSEVPPPRRAVWQTIYAGVGVVALLGASRNLLR